MRKRSLVRALNRPRAWPYLVIVGGWARIRRVWGGIRGLVAVIQGPVVVIGSQVGRRGLQPLLVGPAFPAGLCGIQEDLGGLSHRGGPASLLPASPLPSASEKLFE